MEERLAPAAELLGGGLPAAVLLGGAAPAARRLGGALLAGGLVVLAALAWVREDSGRPAGAVAPVVREARTGAALAAIAARAAEEVALSAEGEPLAPPPRSLEEPRQEPAGEASYYAAAFEGRRTASGEPYRGSRLTAAHRTLPFGSRLRVTNLRNGRSVVVRVNDRGPFHPRRVVDLSRAAAAELGMLKRGRARVRLELLSG
jgi:rare lipoprotein A